MDLDLYAVADACRALGGVPVPAHVDNDSYNVLSALGLWPQDAGFLAAELHIPAKKAALEAAGLLPPGLETLTGSDAHALLSLWEEFPLLGPGSIVGLDCLVPDAASTMSIACVTDCWLLPFQNTLLEEFIRRDSDFAVTLARYYCKVMRQLCYDAASQSVNDVFVRLANFLLANWSAAQPRVRMSQQELANAVNCSRASVSRACRLLKAEGVITTEGVGFSVRDWPRMEAMCRRRERLP